MSPARSGPVEVLVALDRDDASAEPFRQVLASQGAAVDLRFARGAQLPAAIQTAEVMVAHSVTPEQVAHAHKLRWFSSWAAGLDDVPAAALLPRGIVLTNASGVHGPNVAEHVMTFILAFAHRFERHLRAQLAGQWRRESPGRDQGADELTGKTLAILGLGRIGEALAVRARAFGMRIVGVKRDAAHRHDSTVAVDRVEPLTALKEVLAEADHVCLVLPLTSQTRHLLDRTRLAWMKPSAYLYNVGRGALIDEPALVDALQAGRLAGAGLDVFEQEPLPASSPLWKLENVLLTPHMAGVTPHYYRRTAELFAENLARYLRDQPLHNVYEPQREY